MSEPSRPPGPGAGDEYWRALLANAADISLVVDDSGRILDATSSFQRSLGWTPEALSERTGFDLVHPHDLHRARDAFARALAGEVGRESIEARVRRSDGTWAVLSGTVTDMRARSEVGAVVVNLRDVTDERARDEESARRAALFRARFDQTGIAQVMLDMEGRITAVNDSYCALVARSRDELVGRYASSLVHPDEPSRGSDALAALLSGARPSVQVDRLLARPDGSAVPVLVDATLVLGPDGSPQGCAAFLQDLTRLRETERERTREQVLYAALQASAHDLAFVSDERGRVLSVSPGGHAVLDHVAEDVLGRSVTDFLHPDDVEAAAALTRAAAAQGRPRTGLFRLRTADGTWRWVESTVTDMRRTPVAGFVSNVRDVHEQREATAALRASEARYRAIVETAEEGIWLLTPDGATVFANGRTALILGVDHATLVAEGIEAVPELLGAPALTDVPSGSAQVRHLEMRYAHPDGRARHLRLVVSRLDDIDPPGQLMMLYDVTQARTDADQLRHHALHDRLTGLANQALVIDRLEQVLEREGAGTAVMLLDLDRFRLVNDSRGHAFGDQVLRAVAERLRSSASPEATVGRFSADAFLIVCEDVTPDQVEARARSWLEVLDAPFDVEGETLRLTASVGATTSPPADAHELLRFADAALHAAKSERNHVSVFHPRLAAQAEETFALSADLREALDAGDLDVVFQPVVDLATGTVRGVEALTRWAHPERGHVSPERFVHVAELTGVSAALDRWVLGRALDLAAPLLRGDEHRYVAVNLSAKNLADADFASAVIEAAAAADLSPSRIVLEVTERAIMSDRPAAVETLTWLRERGYGVAIDDFGTGYSALAYLRDLPVTMLKIDKSFVDSIATDLDARAIVGSIIDMARTVGLTTVAEGVETAHQAALLRQLGCPAGQGWLWSPGVAAESLRTEPFEVRDGAADAPAAVARRPRPVLDDSHGVSRLLELHRRGASLATIAAALNTEGYRRPGGRRWHHTSVARAIHDALRLDGGR